MFVLLNLMLMIARDRVQVQQSRQLQPTPAETRHRGAGTTAEHEPALSAAGCFSSLLETFFQRPLSFQSTSIHQDGISNVLSVSESLPRLCSTGTIDLL